MSRVNKILNADSYKPGQWLQYPPGTEYIYSHVLSRGGPFDKTLFFGLQAFIKEYMLDPITREDIDEAEEFLALHGEPFNREGWEYILEKHNGYLPLQIDALPEGSIVPVKTPLVTVVNTDPKCFWLTSYIETALLRAVWYPTTVATISHNIRMLIKGYLEETGDVAGLDYKLHDFGARGVSSFESAGIGDLAHLATGARGTDTMTGLLFARKYYNEKMAGESIFASEHSTITSWGKSYAGEVAAYRNMLKIVKERKLPIFACVSDSYNIFTACGDIWGGELKQEVIDSGAIAVIRPDSGDPVLTCIKVIEILDAKFGHTVNAKGFKVLNNVRIIQGDGVNYTSINAILMNFKARGYSADNIAFGMGGALLQQLNRDTLEFAMKTSAAYIGGEWHDVSKSPVGQEMKKSRGGRFTVTLRYGVWETHQHCPQMAMEQMLGPVYRNGSLRRDYTLMGVRAEVAAYNG